MILIKRLSLLSPKIFILFERREKIDFVFEEEWQKNLLSNQMDTLDKID